MKPVNRKPKTVATDTMTTFVLLKRLPSPSDVNEGVAECVKVPVAVAVIWVGSVEVLADSIERAAAVEEAVVEGVVVEETEVEVVEAAVELSVKTYSLLHSPNPLTLAPIQAEHIREPAPVLRRARLAIDAPGTRCLAQEAITPIRAYRQGVTDKDIPAWRLVAGASDASRNMDKIKKENIEGMFV